MDRLVTKVQTIEKQRKNKNEIGQNRQARGEQLRR